MERAWEWRSVRTLFYNLIWTIRYMCRSRSGSHTHLDRAGLASPGGQKQHSSSWGGWPGPWMGHGTPPLIFSKFDKYPYACRSKFKFPISPLLETGRLMLLVSKVRLPVSPDRSQPPYLYIHLPLHACYTYYNSPRSFTSHPHLVPVLFLSLAYN